MTTIFGICLFSYAIKAHKSETIEIGDPPVDHEKRIKRDIKAAKQWRNREARREVREGGRSVQMTT